MRAESIEQQLTRFVSLGLRDGITHLELIHCTEKGDLLLEDNPISPETAEAVEVAGDILRTVHMMVEYYPAPQRFAVQSFITTRDIVRSRHEFIISANLPAMAPRAMSAEPATGRGLIAALIKHKESAFAGSIELARQVARMRNAQAQMAEVSFNRYIEEKRRTAGLRALAAQQAHDREMAERKDERQFEIMQCVTGELQTLFGALRPDIARALGVVLGVSTDAGTPRRPRAPSKGQPPDEGAEHGEPPSIAAPAPKDADDSQEPRAAPSMDTRRVDLVAALRELTDDDVDNLETALGIEKAHGLIRAAACMLDPRADTLAARRAGLLAVLRELTDDDVNNLEKALGTEKAQRFVRAVGRMLD